MLMPSVHWILFLMKRKSILEATYIYLCTITAYNTSALSFWINFEFHNLLICCWTMGLEIYQTVVFPHYIKRIQIWCSSTKDSTCSLAYQANCWYVGLINNTGSLFSKCNFDGSIAIMKMRTLFYAFVLCGNVHHRMLWPCCWLHSCLQLSLRRTQLVPCFVLAVFWGCFPKFSVNYTYHLTEENVYENVLFDLFL